MKVVLTGGGSAGHVTPNIAIANKYMQALVERSEGEEKTKYQAIIQQAQSEGKFLAEVHEHYPVLRICKHHG